MSIAPNECPKVDEKYYPDAPIADYGDEVSPEQIAALKAMAEEQGDTDKGRKIIESVEW